MLDVQYGADLETGNEEKPVDLIVGNLMDEILARQEDMSEHQAHLENFPLGNEYEPDRKTSSTAWKCCGIFLATTTPRLLWTQCRLNAVLRAFARALKPTKKATAELKSCSTATTWVLPFRTR